MIATIFLGLGTNLGDRLQNLLDAVVALPPIVQVTRVSSIYETPPWGYLEQPAFLNQVLEGQTELTPLELLDFLKDTERALGRQASFHYGPRRIDLDILFYDNQVMATPTLTIPHPHLAERAFVLVPLAELAPGLVHPLLHQPVRELLAQVDASGVKKFREAMV